MRNERTTPAYGDKRHRTKFLWIPLEIRTYIDGGSETISTRWWETATWEEVFTKGRIGNFWKRTKWIN